MITQGMIIQCLPMCCECGHEFILGIVVACPVDVAVANMKEVRCPKCGKGSNGVGIITGKGQANG